MESPLPGAIPFPIGLSQKLKDALLAKGQAYRPRTHHLGEDGRPHFTNRLILEKSPYLLQHAHNPVNWFPWGDEPFEVARQSGRPVFLSVGYSTCHWCHVMEGESFEDLEIAELLNSRFVPIKVDREERPDVDAVYMTAIQLLTGSGGWPMSVFLTADREPFFGGTYFPPRTGVRGASRGFLELLSELSSVWERDRGRVTAATSPLTQAVRTALGPTEVSKTLPGAEPIAHAVEQVAHSFDDQYGGLRRAPKFPSSLPVRLLLRHHRRTGDARSLSMATFTLERMAAGGIHDQVGGGFHRYSTDAAWLVPHFEKMLYDNAQLAVAYAEAFQVTGRADFARVTRSTLDYLLRELTSKEGGLFSATDADSEGEEGLYFTWEARELQEILGKDAGPFMKFHGARADGNFGGRNILWVPEPDEERFLALDPARSKLLAIREKRIPPLRDEKILTGWNGLAISALSSGGRVLDEPRYTRAAERAASFVLERMVLAGRLQRRYMDGEAGVPAFLEDYAFLAQGLIDLFEATFEPAWLGAAKDLCEKVETLFSDPDGGWFSSAKDHEHLLVREKPTHDGAVPSGGSVATMNALRLEAFTADPRWRRIAEGSLRSYRKTLEEQPLALGELLSALDTATDLAREVVLVFPKGASLEPFLTVLRRTYLPSRAIAGAEEGEALSRLALVAPIARDKVALGGRPTAYVCQRGACQLPAIEADELAAQITPARAYGT